MKDVIYLRFACLDQKEMISPLTTSLGLFFTPVVSDGIRESIKYSSCNRGLTEVIHGVPVLDPD